MGHLISKMIRMKLCCTDGINRQAAIYGSLDGALGYIAPIWDMDMFSRLLKLQKSLVLNIQHVAGLNPASFR